MEFEYTDHVEENLVERNLSKKMVEDAVLNPDELAEGSFGRKIANKIIGDKLLRVIYEQENNVYIIITAYYTKPARYKVK